MIALKIGDRLKEARKAKGLTQKELSNKSGVSIASIQLYEYGRIQPTFEPLQKIAKALEVPISRLIDAPDSFKPKETASVFMEWLDAFGFMVDIHSEYGLLLTDITESQDYAITHSQLEDLEKSIAAYTKFQVREMLKTCRSVPSNQKDGEPHA